MCRFINKPIVPNLVIEFSSCFSILQLHEKLHFFSSEVLCGSLLFSCTYLSTIDTNPIYNLFSGSSTCGTESSSAEPPFAASYVGMLITY